MHWNLSPAVLYEVAIRKGEAELASEGPLVARTGQHTGRSPQDKFTVRDANVENDVWWDINKAMKPESFELLLQDMLAHCAGKDLFVQDLYGGADPALRAFFEARGYVVEYVPSIGHYIMRRDYREAAPDAVPGAKPPPRLSFEVC